MRNSSVTGRIYTCLQHRCSRKFCSSSTLFSHMNDLPFPTSPKPGLYSILQGFKSRCISLKPTSNFASLTPFRQFTTDEETVDDASDDSNGEVEPIDTWEEEDEAEPEVGDGGDGGGVALQNCAWGERVLSISQEVLLEFGEDMKLYAFKTSPRGYIYVRLDKLSNEYGCPSMEEIESFSRQYKKKLDEIGESGEIPDDLALEVSSPGVERLLKVPDDLLRFKEMPMVVSYLEDTNARSQEKTGVYFLDSVDTESECCVWKLADVRENRDPEAKGRPMSRKQKDARLKLPYAMIKRVNFYISY
ncbi:hypothetical protein ACS0TY_009749 [Phlomoides rotata]